MAVVPAEGIVHTSVVVQDRVAYILVGVVPVTVAGAAAGTYS